MSDSPLRTHSELSHQPRRIGTHLPVPEGWTVVEAHAGEAGDCDLSPPMAAVWYCMSWMDLFVWQENGVAESGETYGSRGSALQSTSCKSKSFVVSRLWPDVLAEWEVGV